MFDRLKVPLSLTWEIYGDNDAHFNDCFRMFNPTTREKFDEVGTSSQQSQRSISFCVATVPHCLFTKLALPKMFC